MYYRKILFYFFLVFFVFMTVAKTESKPCVRRSYGRGSYVCVCNATYCDTIDPVTPLPKGKYVMYSSDKSGLRFYKQIGSFNRTASSRDYLTTVDSTYQYQDIYGWGGAFTDAAGINILSLNSQAQENLLKSFFSKEGIEYSLCRVALGSTDFSLNYYSYDEVANDTNLKHFNLTREDYVYKIPFIKQAILLSNNTVKFFGSTWSPPLWMKTNPQPAGLTFLKKQYYQTWADYHVKALDAYRENGIEFWGITTGNEPLLGLTPLFKIPGVGWLPWDQGKWIAENFGPSIRNNLRYSHLKIISLDDERVLLPFWIFLTTYSNNATKYFDGIGIHWYADQLFPFALTLTKLFYPDKFLLGTEACTGDLRYKERVVLGNWRRGEEYIENIIQNLEHFYTGWVDWNLVLNLIGGPSYIKNFADATIIVNATSQEFYKQPTFYALGHFSKFIPPKSNRIYTTVTKRKLKIIAFERPDKSVAVIIYNRHSNNLEISIEDDRRGYINVAITARSVNTIIYW